MLSIAEKDFIRVGVDLNVRSDGRKRLDYRHFSVETGVLPQTNGSCRVQMNHDRTEILVGVKVEVTPIDSLTPKVGHISCNVEWYDSITKGVAD